MRRADDTEVPVVQGCDLALAEAFAHGYYRGVDQAEREVGILAEQNANADVAVVRVAGGEQRAGVDYERQGGGSGTMSAFQSTGGKPVLT